MNYLNSLNNINISHYGASVLQNTHSSNFYFNNVSIENELYDLLNKNDHYPYGVYYGGDYYNNILPDRTLNKNNAIISGTKPYIIDTGNFKTLIGTTNTTIMFPNNCLNSNFTLCSITRYNSSNYNYILSSTDGNIIHGHYNGINGYIKYNNILNNKNITNNNNFVIACCKNSNILTNSILLNNKPYGNSNINIGNLSNKTLSINAINGGKSDFGFVYLIIWNKILEDKYIQQISTAFINYIYKYNLNYNYPLLIDNYNLKVDFLNVASSINSNIIIPQITSNDIIDIYSTDKSLNNLKLFINSSNTTTIPNKISDILYYFSFTTNSSNSFHLLQDISCDILIVGGGGNGGISIYSGGGGGGEIIYTSNYTLIADKYDIIVGGTSSFSSIQDSSGNIIARANGGGNGGYNVYLTFTFISYELLDFLIYNNIPSTLGSVIISDGFTTINGYYIPVGYQIWRVEYSGLYNILAAGAGGQGYGRFNGGNGIVVSTTYYLLAGQYVIILVGQKSATNGAGGGGTYVSLYSGTGQFNNINQHTLILVAGGGGGSGNDSNNGLNQSGINATITTSGTLSYNSQGSVATNGGGGSFGGGNGGNGTSSLNGYTYNSGGGGGFIGNGGNGGISFLNGGYGGLINNGGGNGLGLIGGFGGGGSSYGSGGGGGGYSGGQAAINNISCGGGGGGSYDINGVNKNATIYNNWNDIIFGSIPGSYNNGYNDDNGFVIINSIITSLVTLPSNSGGGFGGMSNSQAGAIKSNNWNSNMLHGISSNGYSGSLYNGGNGGGVNYNCKITSNNVIYGIGGSGATAYSKPSKKNNNTGNGGDGNGGIGSSGIVVIKVYVNNNTISKSNILLTSNMVKESMPISSNIVYNPFIETSNLIKINFFNSSNEMLNIYNIDRKFILTSNLIYDFSCNISNLFYSNSNIIINDINNFSNIINPILLTSNIILNYSHNFSNYIFYSSNELSNAIINLSINSSNYSFNNKIIMSNIIYTLSSNTSNYYYNFSNILSDTNSYVVNDSHLNNNLFLNTSNYILNNFITTSNELIFLASNNTPSQNVILDVKTSNSINLLGLNLSNLIKNDMIFNYNNVISLSSNMSNYLKYNYIFTSNLMINTSNLINNDMIFNYNNVISLSSNMSNYLFNNFNFMINLNNNISNLILNDCNIIFNSVNNNSNIIKYNFIITSNNIINLSTNTSNYMKNILLNMSNTLLYKKYYYTSNDAIDIINDYSDFVNLNDYIDNNITSVHYNKISPNIYYYPFITSSNIFKILKPVICNILVVGGGGDGGINSYSGGGGAGEVIYSSNYILYPDTYYILVGSSNLYSSISNGSGYTIVRANGGGNGGYYGYNPTSGGSSGGGCGSNIQNGAIYGNAWNLNKFVGLTYYGSNGTISKGGDGGGANLQLKITSNTFIYGVGGSGATINSIPNDKPLNSGYGGDGNGGKGSSGIVVIMINIINFTSNLSVITSNLISNQLYISSNLCSNELYITCNLLRNNNLYINNSITNLQYINNAIITPSGTGNFTNNYTTLTINLPSSYSSITSTNITSTTLNTSSINNTGTITINNSTFGNIYNNSAIYIDSSGLYNKNIPIITNYITTTATYNSLDTLTGYYLFTNGTNTIQFLQNISCDLLIVGKGGDGNSGNYGGGGGGGEIIYKTNYTFNSGLNYTININSSYSSILNNNTNSLLALAKASSNINTSNITNLYYSFNFTILDSSYFNPPSGNTTYNNFPNDIGFITISNGSTTINGYTIPTGYQIWKVLKTGICNLVAGGARGDNYNSRSGGMGVVIKTTVNLTAGQYIIIATGKYSGQNTCGNGGGGTFITIYSATGNFNLASQHTILLIAGGGGGACSFINNNDDNGKNAIIYTYGGNGTYQVGSVATNGGGGGAHYDSGGNGTNGGNGTDNQFNYNDVSSGGGGFIGNGGSGLTTTSKSFLNGCYGGYNINGNYGGFGGGGCGSIYFSTGGGGGGYSGGNSGFPGGGGGSYDINGNNNYATLYTSWETSIFGSAPSTYNNGYNNGNGFAYIYYSTTSLSCNVITFGGSGGGGNGGSSLQSGTPSGNVWNSNEFVGLTYTGNNGTISQGGNGGGTGFTSSITGNSIIYGLGGTGATSSSTPSTKISNTGSGGDGNGGSGASGCIVIKTYMTNDNFITCNVCKNIINNTRNTSSLWNVNNNYYCDYIGGTTLNLSSNNYICFNSNTSTNVITGLQGSYSLSYYRGTAILTDNNVMYQNINNSNNIATLPIVWYRFDDIYNLTKDYGSLGLNLTKVGNGGIYTSSVFKRGTGSVKFNNDANYFISPSINVNVPLTLSFWFLAPTGATYQQEVLSYGNTGILIEINPGGNNYISLVVSANSTFNIFINTTFGIIYDKWYHLVITLTNTNPTNVSFYVDGVLISSANGNSSSLQNCTYLAIGYRQDSAAGTSVYIDDVRIYNYVLPYTEILKLYYNTTYFDNSYPNVYDSCNVILKPLAWYKFDGNLGIDSSGNNNTLTLNNTPLIASGVKGANCLYLSGSQYLNGTTNFNLTNSSFSISLWACLYNTQIMYYSIGNVQSARQIIYSYANSGNFYINGFHSDDCNSRIYNDLYKWVHLVFIFDNTTLMRSIYRNGKQLNITSGLFSGGSVTVNNNFIIGRWVDLSAFAYNGLIDDFRVYNKVLDQNQINELYTGRITVGNLNDTITTNANDLYVSKIYNNSFSCQTICKLDKFNWNGYKTNIFNIENGTKYFLINLENYGNYIGSDVLITYTIYDLNNTIVAQEIQTIYYNNIGWTQVIWQFILSNATLPKGQYYLKITSSSSIDTNGCINITLTNFPF